MRVDVFAAMPHTCDNEDKKINLKFELNELKFWTGLIGLIGSFHKNCYRLGSLLGCLLHVNTWWLVAFESPRWLSWLAVQSWLFIPTYPTLPLLFHFWNFNVLFEGIFYPSFSIFILKFLETLHPLYIKKHFPQDEGMCI